MRGHVLHYSQHKYASNVIEKCLREGDNAQRNILITEILGEENAETLTRMMRDQFANYVVQRMFDVAGMCDCIEPRVNIIHFYCCYRRRHEDADDTQYQTTHCLAQALQLWQTHHECVDALTYALAVIFRKMLIIDITGKLEKYIMKRGVHPPGGVAGAAGVDPLNAGFGDAFVNADQFVMAPPPGIHPLQPGHAIIGAHNPHRHGNAPPHF